MKIRAFICLGFVLFTFIIFPSLCYSGHGYYGPYRYYRGGYHGHYDGWAIGAGIAGGLLLGVLIGNAISQPAPYYPLPPRAYAYPDPNSAYAYPDPDFIEKYDRKSEAPPGEWVTVPGQWVNGKWVSEHRVWVPVNP